MLPIRRIVFVTLAILIVLTPFRSALSQSATDGAIGGVVFDGTRAVLSGAAITARNLASGHEDSATSDSAGRFRISGLQPAVYSVAVKVAGFAPYRRENVIVEVGRVTDLEIPLAVAGHQEVVEVEGRADVLDTEQHDFSTNLNQTTINETPLNGSRWSSLALLTPGATPDGDYGLISFRGISGLLNNNTVDGADNNQAFYSEERGRTRVSFVLSSDAIQEFQVNTSNYSAQYGRAAGGVVNAVTKSGTNTLHGSLFYFNRSSAFNATNPFTRSNTIVDGHLVTAPIKPDNIRHRFGGTVGGPIRPGKLFFFFSYDQQKNPNPGVAVTADSDFLNPITLDPSLPARATCNTSGLTPGQRLFACGITQAQSDATIGFLVGLTGATPREFNQFAARPKFDWHITSNHRLTLSYNRMRWFAPGGVQTQATVARSRDGFGNDYSHTDSAILRLTSAFAARFSNDLTYQWARDLEFQRPQTPLPGQPTTVAGYPPEACIGCTSSGSSVQTGFLIGRPHSVMRTQPDEKRNQFADTFVFGLGRHILKAGVDYNRVWEMQDQLFYDSPEYAYTSLADFIVDVNKPSAKRYSSFQQGFGPSRYVFTTHDYNFFLQDDWRVNRRLTLNLGLRYEYERLPEPILANPAAPQTSRFPSDTNNFGPRAGFALDLLGDRSTALRGGYGIFYARIIGSTILNAMINTGMPGGQDVYYLTYSNPSAPLYPNILSAPPSVSSSPPSIVFFQKDFQVPMVHQSDLVLERAITRSSTLSASWLFSKGTNMPAFIDQNLSPPTGSLPIRYIGGPLDGRSIPMRVFYGDRPNRDFYQMTQISSVVRSNYNALVVAYKRRMSRGLQADASYTWSHAIDTQQSSTTFTTGNNLFDPYDLSSDRGNSSFNVPQRFVAHIYWEPRARFDDHFLKALFNGWSFAPVFIAQNGRQRDTSVSGSAPFSGQTQAGGVNGSNGWNRVPALPRNYLRLPNPWVLDLRVKRTLRFHERTRLEFIAEGFNIFNHLNPTGMTTTMYSWGGTAAAPTLTYCGPTNPSCTNPVGRVTASSSYTFRERHIQMAVRFYF